MGSEPFEIANRKRALNIKQVAVYVGFQILHTPIRITCVHVCVQDSGTGECKCDCLVASVSSAELCARDDDDLGAKQR